MHRLASNRLSPRGESRVRSVTSKVSVESELILLMWSAGSTPRLRLLLVLLGSRGDTQPREWPSSWAWLPRLMLLVKCWAMALALSSTEDGRMLVASHSFCASSLMSSSSSEDSSLLRVLESVLAEEGFLVGSGSLSGFRSSDLWGDSEILRGVVSKMSGSEHGSGSGFSVSSDSGNFSCFNSSLKAYRRRTSKTGKVICTGIYFETHLSKDFTNSMSRPLDLLTGSHVSSVPPGSPSSGSCPFSLGQPFEEMPPPSVSFSKDQREQHINSK